jgi:tRNA pseudouridine32 synthase/23S rRNA pseudouridine746 synthase
MFDIHLSHFKSDISKVIPPLSLNNPFGYSIPEIVKIAAAEFQDFIEIESKNWEHDFLIHKGKMFGVLVVQNQDLSFSYLRAVSGKLVGDSTCNILVPSVFKDSMGDFFINKGMNELTKIGDQIKLSILPDEVATLKETRKKKSIVLQQKLFDYYHFTNLSGIKKNIIQIFKESSQGPPPSASGECSAPKLLQYALNANLKPIAIAEFWWGKSLKNNTREHLKFYPACSNKCRPILEFMLGDFNLYTDVNPS